MHFLQPQNLFWLFLLAVPVALYLFRRQSKTVRVSTLNFFKTLAKAHSESPWMRWLKRLLSFLLTAGVLVGVTGAMARPVVSPEEDELKNLVLLIDRSASMGTKPKNRDQHRLENGLEKIRNRLSGVPEGVNVMVIAYDRRPEILRSFTLERRRIHRALDRIRVRPVEGDPNRALRLARRLASFQTPSTVWHVTDTTVSGGVDTGTTESESNKATSREEVRTQRIDVGGESPVNGGITAFQLRRKPMNPGQLEAFIELRCTAEEPVESELEIRVDGTLTEIRTISLNDEKRERLLVPFEAGSGKVLEAELSVPGDRLPTDNEVKAFIPDFEPIDVLWIHPEPKPFTKMALLTLETDQKINLSEGGPEVWPPNSSESKKHSPDVVLFDSWVPEKWPGDLPAAVMNPPKSTGPVQAAPIEDGSVAVQKIRNLQRLHPLSFGISVARLNLEQTSVIQAGGSLDPIWSGSSGPLLAAGTVEDQRIVVMPFSPETSGRFPLMAAYPILMGNVVFWCAGIHNVEGSRPTGQASIHSTGEVVKLKGKRLVWMQPSGSSESENTPFSLEKTETRTLDRPWVELDRTGLWKTNTGERGSSLLLSARETMLHRNKKSDGSNESSRETPPADRSVGLPGSLFRGDLSTMFLWAVLVFLLTESWLRNRWAVY